MDRADQTTAVEAYRHRRRWLGYLAALLFALLVVALIVAVGVGVTLLLRISGDDTTRYAEPEAHFKYGSIGSEPASGVPYGIWKALPRLYPAEFGGRDDYSAFGLLYETDAEGRQRDLPIGVSRREVRGVDVVWLNCASCHVGTWRASESAPRQIVAAMPSNNLEFERFVSLLLTAAADERLAPDALFPVMHTTGTDLDSIDRLIWSVGVLPRFREGLVRTRARLLPLMEMQPAWGPGRVDTFNPYKLIQFGTPATELAVAERIGVSDFPAVFNQGPRNGMNLHWDGNNASLRERNLSAAIGAGVTPATVDHDAIERVATWLRDLEPPPSPHRPDPAAVARGAIVYRDTCAGCHGERSETGYLFEGAELGQVTSIAEVATDRARLDSYSPWFQRRQTTELFVGTPHQFRSFKKTDGYANMPLDGLWLRGPYLHNGSVPTLAELLEPPSSRPAAFLRGSDVVDLENGGFVSPPCDSARPPTSGFCFDTGLPGNGSGGHAYGVTLSADKKADLLAHLLTY